jgi:flagellar biosynthesis component FlhA
MSGWIETFTNLLQNPFFLILAVIIAVLIVFGVIKKLFKLAMIILAAFVIYIAYLMWTGQDFPTSFDGIKDSVKETISRTKNNVEETKDATKKKAGEVVEEGIKDMIDGD